MEVLDGKPDHICRAAVGRPVETHPLPLLLLEVLDKKRLVLDLLRQDDLVGDRSGAVILEEKGGEGGAGIESRSLPEDPLGDEHTLSEGEDNDLDPPLFQEETPYVPVDAEVLVDALLLHEPFDGEILLLLGPGVLEIPVPGRLLDLLFELLEELVVLSHEKIGYFVDDGPVRFLVYRVHARGRALVDASEHTGSRPSPKDGVPASPHGVDRLDDLHEVLSVLRVGVGAEIEGSIVLDGSRDGEAGELVLHAEAQGDIGLVVLEHHVVSGLVLLDEVVFEKKGLLFVARKHEGHVLDAAQETLGLAVLLASLEVAPYPVLEASRLADVDYFPGFVLEHVNAGRVGEVG